MNVIMMLLLFLMQEFIVEDKEDMKCVRKFHTLWLEILAALHCVLYMKLEDFERFLNDLFQNFEKNIYRFVAIHESALLCEKETVKCLKMLLPSCQISCEKNKAFENNMEKQIEKSENTFSSFLFLCSLAHSRQDEALACKCAKLLGNLIEVYGDIHPVDVVGLCYAHQSSKEGLLLSIGKKINFIQESSQSLLKSFVLVHAKVKNKAAYSFINSYRFFGRTRFLLVLKKHQKRVCKLAKFDCFLGQGT